MFTQFYAITLFTHFTQQNTNTHLYRDTYFKSVLCVYMYVIQVYSISLHIYADNIHTLPMYI